MWKQYIHGPTVLKFGADWCASCREAEVILKELEEEYGQQIKFVRIDVDTCEQALIDDCGVNELPAMFVFSDAELKPASLEDIKAYCKRSWRIRGEDYYTLADVEQKCKETGKTIEDFNRFISGQACPICEWEKPRLCYFAWDVERFFRC